MAPPKKIVKRQQEIMIDFLERNIEMAKGIGVNSPVTTVAMKEKWVKLTRKLNSVAGGDKKSVQGWKRYWFTWRHRCSKKAENVHKIKTEESSKDLSRFLPLDEIEVRVLRLNQKRTVRPMPVVEFIKHRDSDSDEKEGHLEQQHVPEVSCVHQQTFPVHVQIKGTKSKTSEIISKSNSIRPSTPPPQWAIDLEDRRIAAEERMADALQALANSMRLQEERRCIVDERIADALTSIAGNLQEITSNLQHTNPLNNIDLQPKQENALVDVLSL